MASSRPGDMYRYSATHSHYSAGAGKRFVVIRHNVRPFLFPGSLLSALRRKAQKYELTEQDLEFLEWHANDVRGIPIEDLRIDLRDELGSQAAARISEAVAAEIELEEKGGISDPEKRHAMYASSRPLPPLLRTFIFGLHDPKSSLHRLRGQSSLLRMIWLFLMDLWKAEVSFQDVSIRSGFVKDKKVLDEDALPYAMLDNVKLPAPSGISINMMPVRIGKMTVRGTSFPAVDVQSLPKRCLPYVPIIDRCLVETPKTAIGKVFYLTIDESEVKEGTSQRRPGLHVESPGYSRPSRWNNASNHFRIWHGWGLGRVQRGGFDGGVWMVSNVDDSCAVYSAVLTSPQDVHAMGDIEHMRPLLKGRERKLRKGDLVWMTDRTPHESLPVAASTKRQFFRLVGPDISVWFADHSTANKMVTPPKHVRVVHGCKFKMLDDEGRLRLPEEQRKAQSSSTT